MTPKDAHSILEKLQQADLLLEQEGALVLKADVVESHLLLSEEEAVIVYWSKVVQYKYQASRCSGVADYLSRSQLKGLTAYESKLYLTPAERAFIKTSRQKRAALWWICLGKIILGLCGCFLVGMLFYYINTNHRLEDELLLPQYTVLESTNSPKTHYLCRQVDITGNWQYGFVDTNRQLVVPCIYQEATVFDKLGLAKVRLQDQWYYLDTNGQRYQLAIGMDDLKVSSQALELKHLGLTKLPPAVYQAKSLKILDLSHNKLNKLETELQQLDELEYLNLKDNNLKKVPEVVYKMKKLKAVTIEQNPVTEPTKSPTSSQLVIHFGGNRMKTQVHESKYGKRTKKESPRSNAVTKPSLEPETLDSSVVVGEPIDSLPQTAPVAKGKKRSLEGFSTLINEDGVEWKYKLQPYGEQYKLLVIVLVGKGMVSGAMIPKKATKMVLVSGFERQVYAFEYVPEPLLLNGRKGFINACILEQEDLEWMANNVMTQMRLFDTNNNQTTAYTIESSKRYDWKTYVSQLLDKNK